MTKEFTVDILPLPADVLARIGFEDNGHYVRMKFDGVNPVSLRLDKSLSDEDVQLRVDGYIERVNKAVEVDAKYKLFEEAAREAGHEIEAVKYSLRPIGGVERDCFSVKLDDRNVMLSITLHGSLFELRDHMLTNMPVLGDVPGTRVRQVAEGRGYVVSTVSIRENDFSLDNLKLALGRLDQAVSELQTIDRVLDHSVVTRDEVSGEVLIELTNRFQRTSCRIGNDDPTHETALGFANRHMESVVLSEHFKDVEGDMVLVPLDVARECRFYTEDDFVGYVVEDVNGDDVNVSRVTAGKGDSVLSEVLLFGDKDYDKHVAIAKRRCAWLTEVAPAFEDVKVMLRGVMFQEDGSVAYRVKSVDGSLAEDVTVVLESDLKTARSLVSPSVTVEVGGKLTANAISEYRLVGGLLESEPGLSL